MSRSLVISRNFETYLNGASPNAGSLRNPLLSVAVVGVGLIELPAPTIASYALFIFLAAPPLL